MDAKELSQLEVLVVGEGNERLKLFCITLEANLDGLHSTLGLVSQPEPVERLQVLSENGLDLGVKLGTQLSELAHEELP